MRNILLVIKHEILTTVLKPAFWFMTFIFPIIIMGFSLLPTLITQDAIEGGSLPTAVPLGIMLGLVIGKPAGIEEAERFLRMLSGRVHRVHTGLALYAGRERPMEVEAVSTEVRFRALDEAEIQSYLESGEWAGAAGGYRIQERGAFLVEWIRGSWSNVVGLPLEAFYGMLRRTGYRF